MVSFQVSILGVERDNNQRPESFVQLDCGRLSRNHNSYCKTPTIVTR